MQVFPIEPGSFKAAWLVVPVGLILLITFLVLVLSLRGAKSARFEISPEGLRLSGDFYGRMIPASSLRGGAAQRIDFRITTEYEPVTKTMGTSVGGYRAGWFRLRNGEKALLYLTDPSRTVYIPTREGYSVILSPHEPDAFLFALRAIAPSP